MLFQIQPVPKQLSCLLLTFICRFLESIGAAAFLLNQVYGYHFK